MPKTRITWADAQLMPEDGKLYEAIDGELYVTPAPTLRHQWIAANLVADLQRLLVARGHGWLFFAPLGVEFPETEEGVQPDIIFISKARRALLTEAGVSGPPDLVVEIGSPSTANRDRSIKRKLYERQGVAQYWIVDAATDTVEVWDFAAGAQEPARHTERLTVCLGGRDYGTIQLFKIFPPEL
ncbi:MAG: Uma2 family endonuclease [Gemmatimonadota bacterium]|nr:MAG: Uma2 family endonuclease [Gemmatimonadota bacterium]